MGKQILLVDDEPTVLKMVALRLRHEGYEVVTAMDGEEALKQIASRRTVDLVLLDLRMPKLDGFQVCQALKANPATAQLPIILFTASSASWQEVTNRCLELGVADCLRKPFRSAELLSKIRRALEADKPVVSAP